MKLTPLDIRRREFKRGMRGYVDVEVDEFLDQVADEFERLFKENIDLSERVEGLEDKVGQYQRLEATLQKTLVSAQQSAEELKANAQKEAQLVLADAELKARELLNASYAEKQRLDKQMALLKGNEEEFRVRFRSLLEGFLRQLEKASSATAEAEKDFARQAEAIKQAIERDRPARQAAAPPPAEQAAAPPPPAPAVAVQETAPEPEAPAASDGDAEATAAPRPKASAVAAAAPRTPQPADDHDLLADVDPGVGDNEFTW